MNGKLIFLCVLTGLVILFIVQNTLVVKIQLLFWSLEMSRALWMLLLLSIGIIIGWVLHGYFNYRKKHRKG